MSSRGENVTFVTSDSDFLSIIFDLFETILQQQTFGVFVLPMLSDDEKISMVREGKKKMLFLNTFDFVTKREKIARDVFADNWKKDYLVFKIKHWSIEEQKYTTLTYRFDETLKNIFLNMFGGHFCPCVKNDDLGKWAVYRYRWPTDSIYDIGTLKVVIKAKPNILWQDRDASDPVHLIYCKYYQEDVRGNLISFHTFT